MLASSAALRRSPVDLARLDTTVSSLLHTVDAQVKTSAPWQTRTVEDTFDATLAKHRAITEAIRHGDPEMARLRMLERHEHDRDTRIRQKVRRDTGGEPPAG
ncbi:FCD domain-containing protein [Streptomyces sp. NPDC046727]|uniref:FCD domain-containing protein n=1 Tax=Streptomyces sp. NPDC046727 TaxID=3155373 RepID=UPI0033BFC56B